MKNKEKFYTRLYKEIGSNFLGRPYEEFKEFLVFCKNASEKTPLFFPICGVEGEYTTEEDYYRDKV